VVIRKEVLDERIAFLRSTVARLREAAHRDLSAEWDQWALERGLQIAAQALFDIGNHVLAGAFSARPKDYAEIAPELVRRGVIAKELATRLQGLAGFRNLLVHEYVELDPMRVRALLNTRLDDFADFADANRGVGSCELSAQHMV
jgi:uncharacterized protein YutE (UPF0331/DUF86 family)